MGYAARLKLGRRWVEIQLPDDIRKLMARDGVGDAHLWRAGGLQVIVSVDNGDRHLSVSHPYRYPTWDEIADAKRKFFPPDREAVIVIPAEQNYVNLHPNCFHIWESRCQQEGR